MGGLQVSVIYFCHILINSGKCQQFLIELPGLKSHADSLSDSLVFSYVQTHIQAERQSYLNRRSPVLCIKRISQNTFLVIVLRWNLFLHIKNYSI
jgi:hypothetical protein